MGDDNKGSEHKVRIHIDRTVYESRNPTSGEALYKLGGLGLHYELFRSIDGNSEDVLVPNSAAQISLEQDEHFYSQKEFEIIVNGRKKATAAHNLNFHEVVALAFENPPTGANILFTIVYRNGPKKNQEGTLVEGGTVKIKNGMIFNVTSTDKS